MSFKYHITAKFESIFALLNTILNASLRSRIRCASPINQREFHGCGVAAREHDARLFSLARRGGPHGLLGMGGPVASIGYVEAKQPLASRWTGPPAHAIGLAAGYVQPQRETPWTRWRGCRFKKDLVPLVIVQACG